MSFDISASVAGESAAVALNAFDRASSSMEFAAGPEKKEIKRESEAQLIGEAAAAKDGQAAKKPRKSKETKAKPAGAAAGEGNSMSAVKAEADLKKRILDCASVLLSLKSCSYGVTEPWPRILLPLILLMEWCSPHLERQ